MQLQPYVDQVQRQLALAAQATTDDAQALAERLVASAEPAVRMALLDAIGDAAAEITAELAPGSVEVRLRDRDPSFVVAMPPSDSADGEEPAPEPASFDDADDEQARINVRMPSQLKQRVEQAAARDGVSINAWLVQAAAARVERGEARSRRARRGPQIGERYTGWVR